MLGIIIFIFILFSIKNQLSIYSNRVILPLYINLSCLYMVQHWLFLMIRWRRYCIIKIKFTIYYTYQSCLIILTYANNFNVLIVSK